MKRKALALGAGVLLAASIAVPASAAPEFCFGTDDTSGVCVRYPGTVLYEDCVWVGDTECVPVTVRGPAYRCWSSTVDLCSAEIRDPLPIN